MSLDGNGCYLCSPDVAKSVRKWLAERGGIAIWPSINLSNPGASWTTPAMNEDGTPTTKPTWQAGDTPMFITDPSKVIVVVPKEVRRFRVAVRRTGMALKLTDASSAKVRRAVAKAGEDAWHIFDYDTQEAVILVAEKKVPLLDFEEGYGLGTS